MNLRIPNGWQELWELHDRIERAFRETATAPGVAVTWKPPLDVAEDGEAYWVCFDLPGVPPERVALEVRDGSLWLSGEKPAPGGENARSETGAAERVLRSERRYGRFAASVPLPREAAPEAISARLKDGVLIVKVPRRAQAGPRRIEVEGA